MKQRRKLHMTEDDFYSYSVQVTHCTLSVICFLLSIDRLLRAVQCKCHILAVMRVNILIPTPDTFAEFTQHWHEMLFTVCPHSDASSCLSLNLWCAGFLLGLFPPSSNRLPSQDVMGHREEAKVNHSSSHDCSTNTAIQEQVSLKQSMFLLCMCVNNSTRTYSHPTYMDVIQERLSQKCGWYKPRVCVWTLWKVREREISSRFNLCCLVFKKLN